jgi:ribosomal protein L11 methyltransferase
MDYIEARVTAPEALREPVMALMAEAGFMAFEETDTGILGYVEAAAYAPERLTEQLALLPGPALEWQVREVPGQNWNTYWESNYPSVEVDRLCQVVPSFREPEPGFRYTLRIDPKMSFGTGHHETTRLMMRQLDLLPVQGAAVLDMGCGTGILAILAWNMGAASVTGIDIDSWCMENAAENAVINGTPLQLIQGDASAIPDERYGIILANITCNILLADMQAYAARLAPGGWLVLSGFYETDVPQLAARAAELGLQAVRTLEENRWTALALQLPG